jgi:flagellar biosynthetic protein FliO
MGPHVSWAQVWTNLRPALLKLVRKPVVWVSGLGLLALFVFTQWAALSTSAAAAPLPGQTAAAPDLFGSMSLAVSITLKLALVIALIYGCMFVLRRWPNGWLGASQKRVALLETTRLSPRQALHLVQVGDRTLLVGATDQSVTLLTEIELPAGTEAVAAPTPAASASPAFTRALDQALTTADLQRRPSQGNSPA